MRVALTIDGLAPGGEGVGEAGGRAVFVPFAAPGDRVEVELEPGEGPGRAALLRVVEAGPARRDPPCPHFGPVADGPERGCGGCEWLHVEYRAQLSAKERGLVERLRRLGRVEPGSYRLLPAVPSPRPLRYRSRARLHLDRRLGRLVFFRRRSHDPVPVRTCHLLEPGLEALREAAGPALLAAGLEPRAVALEWSEREARGSAALHLPALTPAARERAGRLLSALPGLKGLVLLAEGSPPALAGEPVLLHDRVPGDPASGAQRSRPDVFAQANRGANALLVRAALDLLRPDGEEALELFCGAGNFTGPLARRARAVAAAEAQGPALELARRDLEGAPVRFFAGEALGLARALARERGPGAPRFGVALLDPPRDGAKGIGPALRELGVPRAVYVSCDPATLARDVRRLSSSGYRLLDVQPVDMFPQTFHIETVVLLVKE